MIKRLVSALIALVACTSCLPHAKAGPHVWVRLSDARRPSDDHQLLRMLALGDPVGPTAPRPVSAAATDGPVHVGAPPFVLPAIGAGDTQRAADCLTAAVYYEARSEPLDGQRAVAQVVLNRVRDRAFPSSVCKVVYQHPAHGPGCQFSFACDGSTGRPIDERAWAVARGVAVAALAGSVYAPVGSATYYHTTAVLPWWAASLNRIGLVGSHIFYRWREGLGRALSFRQAYSGDEALPQPVAAAVPLATLADATPPIAVDDGKTEVERGVRIHRARLAQPVEEVPAGMTFGVRVHRGASSETI